MQKLKKENKGITLLALIITIIALFILVGVTIATLTGDNGIIEQAKMSNLENRAASIEEQVKLWKKNQNLDKHSDIQTAKTLEELLEELQNQKLITEEERQTIENSGMVEIGDKTIVFDEGMVVLSKYFLGKNFDELYNQTSEKFQDNPETEIDESIEFYKFKRVSSEFYEGENGMVYVSEEYIKYKEKMYQVKTTSANGSNGFKVIRVKEIYTPRGKEGKIYKFDSNLDGVKEDWIILYDHGDSKEIVSPISMGKLLLGYNTDRINWSDSNVVSEAEIDSIEGLSEIEKAIYAYNHSINIINGYCKELITNTAIEKDKIRSVGSGKEFDEKRFNIMQIPHYDVNTDKWFELYDKKAKDGDKKYEQDLARMIYWDITDANKSIINNDYYWIASRQQSTLYNYSGKLQVSFGSCIMNNGSLGQSSGGFSIYSDGTTGTFGGVGYPVRPVVTVSN